MRRQGGFVLRDLAGKTVLVPIGSQVIDMNALVLLNGVGAYIWEILAEDCALEDLAALVVARYGVEIDRARPDVEVFVEKLQRLGLLEVTG